MCVDSVTQGGSRDTTLHTKHPAELLDDARRFATRRPGTFLDIAAGVGLVAAASHRLLRQRGGEAERRARRRADQGEQR